MPKISHIKTNRYRVQFSLGRELYQTYQDLQERANQLQVRIDYGSEFPEWFRNQIDKANHELTLIESKSHNSQTVQHHTSREYEEES